MTQNQSSLRFSLEESIWFKRGQEVEELLSISLDPEISILEQEQYILIQGRLRLSGEFYCESAEEVQDQPGNAVYVQDVRYRDTEGVYEFNHYFPVDVTIPKDRVANLEALDVHIDSFDYIVPEAGCLKLNADLTIYGLASEREAEVEVYDETEIEIEAELELEQEDETYAAYSPEEEPAEPAYRGNTVYEEPAAEIDEETEELEEVHLIPLFQEEPKQEEMALETRYSEEVYEEDSSADSDLFEPFTAESKKVPEQEVEIPLTLDSEESQPVITFTNEGKIDNPQEDFTYSDIYREEPHYTETPPYSQEESSPSQDSYDDHEGHYEKNDEDDQEDKEKEGKAKKHKKKDKYESISLTDFFARKEEEAPAKLKVCIVQQGETLDYLAEKYEINVQQIMRMNHLDLSQDVYEGQVLYIPSYAAVKK